ncbi:thiamine phosphate synthase [Clostridium sp. HCP1S3_B4]|uniref:thiamine phosphate synthase n=1 Tax=unclassified Clostridium TaxID=2614128 RepID=UPI0016B55565|nr:thiamine phosphate synthase [Clostridium sp.]NLK23403.1 thiamine phosphate synthase [Clostridiales bacterium]
MKNNIDLSLYLVTDRKCLKNKDLNSAIEEAILGGVTLVQLREKSSDSLELFNIAKEVKKITDKHNIPLIIDDRIDIAMAVDATGVHLGQEDIPCNVARKILGSDKIIGVSAHNIKEALKAQSDGADYLGCGSVFNTSTKNNVTSLKIQELREIKEKVNIPVVAIGGINEKNVLELRGTGIDGIAIVSAILGKDNIKKAAEELKYTIEFK